MTALTRRKGRTARAAALVFALGAAQAASAEPARFMPYAGAPARAIAAVDLDGRRMTVAAADDRVTLVHFFASWCAPCRRELPALAAFARARPDIRLIPVDVAEPAAVAQRFAAAHRLRGPIAHDEDKAVARAFGVHGVPATVALAPGGRAALAAAGPVDWRAPRTAEALRLLGVVAEPSARASIR